MALQARLEAELEIPGRIWTALRRLGAVAKVESGERDYRWLKTEARRLIRNDIPSVSARSSRGPIEERDDLVSSILHSRASREPSVRAFRMDVPVKARVVSHELIAETEAHLTNARRQRLGQLAESLADRFGWTVNEAKLFALSGAEIQVRSLHFGDSTTPRTGYLVLHVNPLLSPRELSRAYATKRRELFGERMRRLRRQKPKALRLVLFMAKENREGTWAKRMDLWNGQVKKAWHYNAVSNFYRDAIDAERRFDEQLWAYRQDQQEGEGNDKTRTR